jgi:hypothetical protein
MNFLVGYLCVSTLYIIISTLYLYSSVIVCIYYNSTYYDNKINQVLH